MDVIQVDGSVQGMVAYGDELVVIIDSGRSFLVVQKDGLARPERFFRLRKQDHASKQQPENSLRPFLEEEAGTDLQTDGVTFFDAYR